MLAEKTDNLNNLEQEILKRWKKNKKFEISQEVKDILEVKFSGDVLYKEPMAKHTYIKIGGPVDVFLKPNSLESAILAIKTAQKYQIPYHFHGSGANTLVKDGGLRGFVISLYQGLTNIRVIEETDSHYLIEAEAGAPFSQLIKFVKSLPATGLEEFVGIPGSVGGYIKMNAGLPQKVTADVLKSVTLLDKDGNLEEFQKEKIQFSYRHSSITKTQLIVKAVFKVEKTDSEENVTNTMNEFQKRRTEKQPLNFPNLGSIFKNPEAEKGLIKTSAGQLIEDAGLKNVRVGGARISDKHANFIINEGNASAKDVLALIDLAKNKVKTLFGIELETEIKILGEDAV